MPTSIKFYCEGLGFELATSDLKPAPHFDWVLLRLNGTELMLNTAYDEDQRPQAPDPRVLAPTRTPVTYFGCPDVDGAYAHLRERGINVKEPKVAWYGMKQLYLPDPDGYLLCFQGRAEGQASAQ